MWHIITRDEKIKESQTKGTYYGTEYVWYNCCQIEGRWKQVDVNATKVDMPKTKLVTLIPSHKWLWLTQRNEKVLKIIQWLPCPLLSTSTPLACHTYLGSFTESRFVLCLVLNQVTGVELTAAEPNVGRHVRKLQQFNSIFDSFYL